MPSKTTWEARGLYVKFTGIVTPADIARSYDVNLSDSRYYDARYLIADYAEAEGHAFSPGEREQMRELNAPAIGASFSHPHMVMAVVTRDADVRALVLEYARLLRYPVESFETLEEARRWVSRQDPTGRFRSLRPS
jgi:hypothetical protein